MATITESAVLVLPEDYDERSAFETPSRGYLERRERPARERIAICSHLLRSGAPPAGSGGRKQVGAPLLRGAEPDRSARSNRAGHAGGRRGVGAARLFPAAQTSSLIRGHRALLAINSVPIEDTFAEAFPMTAARLIVTAETPDWVRTAAQVTTGYASSVIGCDAEAGVERDPRPRRDAGRPARRQPAAVRLQPRRPAKGRRQPRRPVRPHLPDHRLLQRPAGRQGQGDPHRRQPALLRRRLPVQQEAGGPALLAAAGHGRRIHLRGFLRHDQGRGRRQLPDRRREPGRGPGGGGGGRRRDSGRSRRDSAVSRRRRPQRQQGRQPVQEAAGQHQRRLLPDAARPGEDGPAGRRPTPSTRSSSTAWTWRAWRRPRASACGRRAGPASCASPPATTAASWGRFTCTCTSCWLPVRREVSWPSRSRPRRSGP